MGQNLKDDQKVIKFMQKYKCTFIFQSHGSLKNIKQTHNLPIRLPVIRTHTL